MKLFKKKQKATPQKQQIELPVNGYYEAVSDRFGIAQVLLYLALLAFVAISFLSNTGLITYQNLYYFIKDLGASAENVDVLHTDAVSYPTDESQSFALYRQGLAIAGNTSVTVFTAGGRQSISQNHQYQHPVAVGTGKYLLVYELGGNQYSLYNSYTRIFTGKTDAVIYSAAVSASGMYALTLQASQTPTAVELYNSDFHLIGRYPQNAYMTEVALDPKGEQLAIVASTVSDGAYLTSLRVFRPGEAQAQAEMTVSQSLVLSCAFTDSGDLAILCEDGVYYASNRGKLLMKHLFGAQKLSAVSLNHYGCAVSVKNSSDSSQNRIIVFDKSGKMLYNEDVAENIESVSLCQNTVFLKQTNGILRIQLSDGAKKLLECNTERKLLLAVDESKVFLCSPKKAEVLRFSV